MPDNVQLFLGDCLDILPTLAAGSVDAVITDPPYETDGNVVPIFGYGVTKRINESKTIAMPWGYSLDWVGAANDLCPKHVISFCNSYMIGDLCYFMGKALKPVSILVWHKTNAPPNVRNTPKWDCEFITWYKNPEATNVNAREFRSQIINMPFLSAGCFSSERIIKGNGSQSALHPTQKPLELMKILINNMTEPNWIIIDPFMGLGTTGVAAVQLGRRFIGIEIDPGYFAIAEKRIKQAQQQMLLPLEMN